MILFRSLPNGEDFLRCSEMLANRMQCYSGADYELSNPEDETFTNRQVCRFHARVISQQQIDAAKVIPINVEQIEQSDKPEPTQPIQDKKDLKDVNSTTESGSAG